MSAIDECLDAYENTIRWVPLDVPIRRSYYASIEQARSDLSRLRSIILSSHQAQCVPHYSERNMHAPECPIGELTGEEVERLFNTQSGRDPRGG